MKQVHATLLSVLLINSLLSTNGKSIMEDDSRRLYKGSWQRALLEREYENQPMVTSEERDYDHSKRAVIAAFATGAFLMTKVTDLIDSVSAYNDRMSFVMGVGSAGSSPAEKKDIENLRNQLTKMDSNMKTSFAQVLSGQEFGQVILNYNSYIHHLQHVVLIEVFQHIGDETLKDEPSQELARKIIGGTHADSTEFALLKVHEMLTGKSIFGLGSFYQVVAKKNAACVPTCTANLYDLPILASEFNTLQAAAYGALEAAFRKQGKNDKVTALQADLTERATTQGNMLYLAQRAFVEGAGSGSSFLRLRSAIGGCLAFRSGLKGHLRDCDDPDVLKVKISKDKAFLYNGYDNKCFSIYLSPVKDEYCERNDWFLDINQVDPRFVRLKPRGNDNRCLAANVGEEKIVSETESYKSVARAYNCAGLDDEGKLTVGSENQFWEFIPE